MSSMYKTIVTRHLQRAKQGNFHLTQGDETLVQVFDPFSDLAAEMKVTDESAYADMALGGDIGLGDAYAEGKWSTSDLTATLRWLLRNSGDITPKVGLLQSPLRLGIRLMRKLDHFMRRNNRSNSRRNIHEHYDLGNEFFAAFLDETMTYSSAFFRDGQQSLSDAQHEKYERLCRKLHLSSNDSLLEIGCGWGGFAIYAAGRYGCKVTATTISKEQFAEARRRVAEAGLEKRIDIVMTDYRDLEGQFTKIASIEMLEAVGADFLKTYFSQVSRLLAAEGLAAVQVITCPTPLYKTYNKDADYIQSRIFPGSHLPSNQALLEACSAGGGLEAMHLESFGLHYAETLRRWRIRFEENWPQIEALGFDDAFYNKWRFYLCYCEAGFLERHVNVSQIVISRPDERGYCYEAGESEGEAPLPGTRSASDVVSMTSI